MIVFQVSLVTTSMKTLTVLGLLSQLLCSTHAQVGSFPESRDTARNNVSFSPVSDPDPICPAGLEHEVTDNAGAGLSQH